MTSQNTLTPRPHPAGLSPFWGSILCLALSFCLSCENSYGQVLEVDPLLPPAKPPVETPRPSNGVTTAPNTKTKIVLKGNIATLDSALVQERGTVDWYGWYMACRQYLILTGGLNECPIGTQIRFNRAGLMTPLPPAPIECTQDLLARRFPLPRDTKLEAIILPVRSARIPPASPEELYQHLRGHNAR